MVLVCQIFAFVLFVIAAGIPYAAPDPRRGRLVAAGLAFWVMASLVPMIFR